MYAKEAKIETIYAKLRFVQGVKDMLAEPLLQWVKYLKASPRRQELDSLKISLTIK